MAGVTAGKRKAADTTSDVPFKKQYTGAKEAFRNDLFDNSILEKYQNAYTQSTPYAHAVVPSLVQDDLLRAVRSEIMNNISFTLKETDIYSIHQSGDLANLSGLDTNALQRLPSLVRLRDALYSPEFRQWVSDVTGAGKLSGQKTDMAVNVYTPGSYLLCHDDVIGSRRVSYILYLTDPDNAWQPGWGGGLRLYPTEQRRNKEGESIKVPLAEHSLNIPPSFGQLSFFTVVPGESYHDVEEVYHANASDKDPRVRMAISGWYHIPQENEDGYEEGLEQSLAQKSSLTQLKSAANEFDEPQVKFRHFDEPRIVMQSNATDTEIDPGDTSDQGEEVLTEQDLTFLLQYMRAHFLAPDMVGQVAEEFENTSIVQLEAFLNDSFSDQLRSFITAAEGAETSMATDDQPSNWQVARPPHKHRYAYYQEDTTLDRDSSPVSKLLVDLLHSHAFKKWLALATGLRPHSLTRQNAIARRFRRGKDYELASPFVGDQPQLEFTIGLSPSEGWDNPQPREHHRDALVTPVNGSSGGTVEPHSEKVQVDTSGDLTFGGEEVYMAGDDDDDNVSTHSKSLPLVGRKADPAVYKSADDEEDSILFANPPTWNTFSVVLRDKGTLRFVKYISEAAVGDRWDIKGEVELADDAFDGEDEQEDGHEETDEDENEEEDTADGEEEEDD